METEGLYRQGDILLIPTTGKMPKDAKPIPLENGRIVLAHGEVTGHSHAIDRMESKFCNFFHFENAFGDRWLQISGGPVSLKHEEHNTIPLTKTPDETRAFIVRRQIEETPEGWRQVQD